MSNIWSVSSVQSPIFHFLLWTSGNIFLWTYSNLLCTSLYFWGKKQNSFVIALKIKTRGSVGWACVSHLSFCFEETLYRTFHGASYQVLVRLAKQFQRRIFFRNRPIRKKYWLWWPCLLTDRHLMSILCRGPSKDACYQVSVQLVKRFQRRRFF